MEADAWALSWENVWFLCSVLRCACSSPLSPAFDLCALTAGFLLLPKDFHLSLLLLFGDSTTTTGFQDLRLSRSHPVRPEVGGGLSSESGQ